jgi:hypothetical protein
MPSAPTHARRVPSRERRDVDERTGRRITIGIAWLAGAPPVILLCAFIASGYPVLKTTVISDGVVTGGDGVAAVQGGVGAQPDRDRVASTHGARWCSCSGWSGRSPRCCS